MAIELRDMVPMLSVFHIESHHDTVLYFACPDVDAMHAYLRDRLPKVNLPEIACDSRTSRARCIGWIERGGGGRQVHRDGGRGAAGTRTAHDRLVVQRSARVRSLLRAVEVQRKVRIRERRRRRDEQEPQQQPSGCNAFPWPTWRAFVHDVERR